jgi:5-methylcytosine-specific restriction endonuclease McrA
MKCLRTRNYKALQGGRKPRSLEKNCGYSGNLMDYIKDTFYTPAMTVDNYGKLWEIDHIVPLSSFDLTDPKQYVVANHYTNLQALLIEDNREKSNRLDWIHPSKRKESERGNGIQGH